MKTKMLLLACAGLLWLNAAVWAQAPHEIGGFVLNRDIAEFKDKLDMASDLPIRYSRYLHDVEIADVAGFKSGVIAYGTCAQPGKIIRIKLKYADSRRKFYDKLLKRFKASLGEPDEWRGDPFQIVIGWKWSFVDQNKQKISLTLQHNTKDTEEKMGNSVKLTALSLIEAEQQCFHDKNPLPPKSKKKKQKNPTKDDWARFVPR